MTRRPVFLSASLPDPLRDARYYGTADLVACREAVRSLAAIVLPRASLVFGGHPAISPLVRVVAERMGHSDRVRIYQSDFFKASFPADNDAFDDLVVTTAAVDRDMSLRQMREEMVNSADFHAGVFIGGMEGVEEELELFAKAQPKALLVPVASSGAAAALLLGRAPGLSSVDRKALTSTFTYGPLFRRILGY